jgi:hypothetical protein
MHPTHFVLFRVYLIWACNSVPNSSSGLRRYDDLSIGHIVVTPFDRLTHMIDMISNSLPYRVDSWDVDFQLYIARLTATKPVCITGDLNVAHLDIDIHSPKTNQKSAGFTPQERASFGKWLTNGYIDVFRYSISSTHATCCGTP